MNVRSIVVEGELYVSFESVSECFAVTRGWVEEAYELRLLGRGLTHESGLLLQARILDRVAELLRVQRHSGLELRSVAVTWFSATPRPPG